MENTYTIMSYDTEHIDEICEDIIYQIKNDIASCALFSMTLVPEGNPPADKAKIYCEKYKLFKEKLSKSGVKNGVLVQASIGHGWVLGEMFPFQQYIGIRDGEKVSVVCPYDEGFREYIYNAMRTIASCKPDHIMVDDDFRLIGRAGGGCACPLHMKRFNELAGTSLSREELYDIFCSDSEKADDYKKIFTEVQRESLIGAAKVMRAGIDSVDKTLPASFCCVGNNAEFAADIAKIICGEGNPVIIRLNNGNYTPAGARYLTRAFFRAAAQIAKVKNVADVILAETDTCPQNRYSTGAMSLHSHFTGSIIEGAAGAKHWITKLNCFEPQSGKAYRNVLKKYSGFYDALSKIIPTLKWKGFRIPVSDTPSHVFDNKDHNSVYTGKDVYGGWGECVLERLGLPMYFSSENSGILCLDGEVNLSDEQLMQALKGNVFLASDSAAELIKRGFGEYIGVDVREWTGKTPSVEELYVNNNKVPHQRRIMELVPSSSDTVIDSMVYNTIDREHYEKLFPGTTIFKNSLGGTIFTFSGAPKTEYNIVEAFSFLNYSRKQQLIRMLKQTDEYIAYYPGDEEVYFRTAKADDGSIFCAVFNIGLDPIDKLELVFARKVEKIEQLMMDGSRKTLDFEVSGNNYTIETSCNTLDPVIIFAK